MIGPLWHGWTTPEDADAYQELLERAEARRVLSRFDERSVHYELVLKV